MTTRTSVNLHFDADDISHSFHPGDSENDRDDYGTIDIGRGDHRAFAFLYFSDTASVDAAIRELAALKTEMLAAQEAGGQ